MKPNSKNLASLFVISSLVMSTQLVVHGHRDGGYHFIRGNPENGRREDQTLANQFAIKPWSSEVGTNYNLADIVLTPSRENVIRTRIQDGSSASSLSEEELAFSSVYPFETETFITFDLSETDIFHDYALSIKDYLRDAQLQLFSFKRLPRDSSFDIVLLDTGNQNGDIEMMWHVDSSSVDSSSCVSSKNCWIYLDVTDGLIWSVNQQKSAKDWFDPFTLTLRVSLRRRQAEVSGSFASSKYDGGSFAPKLRLDFYSQAINGINYHSSTIEPQNKPGRKHIVKGVKGPRKKPKSTSKTNGNINAFTEVADRPNQDPEYYDVQYNTYIIVDTENLPQAEMNQPGRKFLVKGVKGPRKNPKGYYSVKLSRRPTTRPSRRPTKRPSPRPTKKTSNYITATNTNTIINGAPAKSTSNQGASSGFTSIKPIGAITGAGNKGKAQDSGSNVSEGGFNGPSGPNVGYIQGDGPSVTYSQNSQPGTGNVSKVQSSGMYSGGGWSNGPEGPSVGYSQGNGPSVTYSQNSQLRPPSGSVNANGSSLSGGVANGLNGPNTAYNQGDSQSVTYNTGSAPNGGSVSSSESGGSNLWYMNYQIGRCVMDCANGTECGGQANFWDILFESQDNCCRQMNYWNPACTLLR